VRDLFVMRLRLLAFIFAFLPAVLTQAQDPFPDTAPVTFNFRETLNDKVVREPGTLVSDESYLIGVERTITISGSAPLTGFDLTELDEFSTYSIVIGDFDTGQMVGGRLNDDENYLSESSTSILVPLLAFNYDGDEVEVGSISINWNTSQVKFLITMSNVNQSLTEIDTGVAADYYREQTDPIDDEGLTASFSFGPFGYNLRTVYSIGTASFTSDARVDDLLSSVSIDGAIDYVPPTVAITAVKGPGGTLGSTTASDLITIEGSVGDKREIKRANSTVTFDSEVAMVEVQVGTALRPGDFVEVPFVGSSWALANVTLAAGENRIVARATDVHGNVTTSPVRKITFLTQGKIEVQAQATGFPAGPSAAAGTVKASFLPAKSITAKVDGVLVSNSAKNVVAGQHFAATAVPAPGAVFNGWTATLDGAPYFTAVDETLVFETKPNLVLKAEFIPNPFDPLFGIYEGLVTGDNAAERGTFKITVSKTGAFTGRLTAGVLTLPLKGKVLGSGRWEGRAKKGNTEYTIAFTMNVSGAGNRSLNGTLTGGTLSSNLTGDLRAWRKGRGSDPGNLATEFAGAYTVALTPPLPADPLPAGIGYARVTISSVGAVLFLGKLGDGTPVSAHSTLVKRAAGGVFFPLFVVLDKKLGNVSGLVSYSAEPETDLTATLDWNEPLTTKVEPQAFSGQVALSGARYTPPATGGFAILASANGTAPIGLDLPAYTVPQTPPAQPFAFSGTGTLDPTTNLVSLNPAPATQALEFKMKLTPKTGLFAGSFKDPQLSKTIGFSGALVQKANGGMGFAAGVFTRGNKAGAVSFGSPTP
jgi:hypothetical protein